MQYSILEVTSGCLVTESFVVDKTGEVMSTRDVVERLIEQDREIARLTAESANRDTV